MEIITVSFIGSQNPIGYGTSNESDKYSIIVVFLALLYLLLGFLYI